MMSKEEMQVFSKLFSDFCPVNSAYDEVFNHFTDDEEGSNDDDE